MKRLVCAFLALAACHHTRKTLVPEVPQNGNASARASFNDAKEKFLRSGSGNARDSGREFARIVDEYPQDPIAPWAELYAGIADVRARELPKADAELQKVIATNRDPGLVTRAQLFLGMAKNLEGDVKAARELLARGEKAVEGDEERTEYVAAVAYSTAGGEQPLASLAWFDELWKRPGIQPAERAVIVARVEDVIGAAPPELLGRAFDGLADRNGPSFAIAGSRLAMLAQQGGNAQRAQDLVNAVTPVRVAIGLPKTIGLAEVSPAGGGGDPSLVGAALPLGNARENAVAEHAAAGLALAAGAPDGKGVVAIETRAIVDKAAAAEQIDALARANVVAIVGPIGAGTDAAAARADALRVPLLTLSPRAEQAATGQFVFHVRHSPEARAKELARRALAAGVKRFVMMAPDSSYGKATTAAFQAAVEAGGGRIVGTTLYPPDTKSFAGLAKKLPDDADGVFVADDAEKLGLLAPALAAAGHVPKPAGWKKPKKMKGEPVLLLSTAEDLRASYLAAAGSHSEGALLAPGFYPDDADPIAKPFLDRYMAAYGRPPGATEAYAFDAAQLAAAAGAGGRVALATALAGSTLAGVTGAIKFDANHRRSDSGVVYTVVEETGGAFAIRVVH